MIFDPSVIDTLDDTREPASFAAPRDRPGSGRAAVHLCQDGDHWTWMLISEDGKSVAAGRAATREDALQLAQEADDIGSSVPTMPMAATPDAG